MMPPASQRSRRQHDQLLVRALIWAADAISLRRLTWWRGDQRSNLSRDSIKTSVPFMRAPPTTPSHPNYLPETPLPNTIALGG